MCNSLISVRIVQEKKALARDVHMLQGYVSYLRMNLEEGRAVELDVRRLNQALYTELLTANATIGDLQDQIKFYTSVDTREAKLVEVSAGPPPVCIR